MIRVLRPVNGYTWNNVSTTSFTETLPGGTIDLRRGSVSKFIRITGTVDARVDLDPGGGVDMRDARLTIDFMFSFFSGAAFVQMGYADGDPSFVILDGRGTVDELGTPGALEYEWRVRDHDDPWSGPVAGLTVLAHGAYTAVPRAVWTHFFGGPNANFLCLRAMDVDGHYDEQCMKIGLNDPPIPPPNVLPGCGDVAGGPAGVFAALIDAAGMRAELNELLDEGTLFVPTAEALESTYNVEELLSAKNETLLRNVILDHVYMEQTVEAVDIAKGIPIEFVAASGNVINVMPEALQASVVHPDLDCGGGAIVHVVNSVFVPSQ